VVVKNNKYIREIMKNLTKLLILTACTLGATGYTLSVSDGIENYNDYAATVSIVGQDWFGRNKMETVTVPAATQGVDKETSKLTFKPGFGRFDMHRVISLEYAGQTYYSEANPLYASEQKNVPSDRFFACGGKSPANVNWNFEIRNKELRTNHAWFKKEYPNVPCSKYNVVAEFKPLSPTGGKTEQSSTGNKNVRWADEQALPAAPGGPR